MSRYSKNETIYKDRECLLKALAEQGYKAEQVELHADEGAQLFDYCGRPTKYIDAKGDKGNIIVRRNFVGGAANDLGFKLEKDGTYSAIVSEFDRGKHNKQWMTDLKKHYSEALAHKQSKQLGLRFMSTTAKDGVKRIQYLYNG